MFVQCGTLDMPIAVWDWSRGGEIVQVQGLATHLQPYAKTADVVPNSRTLSINGVPFNLSTDRTWTGVGIELPNQSGQAGKFLSTNGSVVSWQTIGSRSFNNAPARALVTVASAANGFQISASRDASVSYSANIATSLTLTGGSSGYVALEICPTNSSTAANWVEISRVSQGQSGSGLVVGLALNNSGGGSLSGIVPAGYFVRLRSVSVSGTPTYTLNGQQEVQL